MTVVKIENTVNKYRKLVFLEGVKPPLILIAEKTPFEAGDIVYFLTEGETIIFYLKECEVAAFINQVSIFLTDVFNGNFREIEIFHEEVQGKGFLHTPSLDFKAFFNFYKEKFFFHGNLKHFEYES